MPRPPRPARRCPALVDHDPGPVLVVNVTVPPLVVLPLLDDRPGLAVGHPREAAVCLVSLEQSTGVKTDTLK